MISNIEMVASALFFVTYEDTNTIYELIALELAKHDALFPSHDHPEVQLYGSRLCTCEKFDASTSNTVKKRIMKSFTKQNGAIRIVVSTVAFAMGIDVPNIHTVLHWGPPFDFECYVQETGRGGRDGCATNAILYYGKGDLSHTNEEMRKYCINKVQCRRLMLMAPFCESGFDEKPKFLHMCCDLCGEQCKCTTCTIDHLSKDDLAAFQDFPENQEDDIDQYNLCCDKSRELYSKLMDLQSDVSTEPASVLVGPEILYGLSNSTLKSIVKNCLLLKGPEDVQSLGITSPVYAKLIYGIVSTFQ